MDIAIDPQKFAWFVVGCLCFIMIGLSLMLYIHVPFPKGNIKKIKNLTERYDDIHLKHDEIQRKSQSLGNSGDQSIHHEVTLKWITKQAVLDAIYREYKKLYDDLRLQMSYHKNNKKSEALANQLKEADTLHVLRYAREILIMNGRLKDKS